MISFNPTYAKHAHIAAGIRYHIGQPPKKGAQANSTVNQAPNIADEI
jgi:hypothetical protein